MFHQRNLLLALAITGLTLFSSVAQEKTAPKPNYISGPATAKLGGAAQIKLPEGYIFWDGAATRQKMKLYGEPVSGHEMGMISSTNAGWSVIFEFSDVGYVKDDEKDKLDPDKMLASIKEGTAEANKERQSMGRAPLEVIGWEQTPHYDETSHNLTWAIRCQTEGHPLLNYNTRLLGRLGVMEVVLVCEPDQLPTTLPTFTDLLAGYTFETGQTYAEYRPGDKIAKYGLAALIIGGAGVAAAKLGLLAWVAVFFKKAWKLLIVAVAAIGNWFRRMYSKVTGKKNDSPPSV